MSINCLVVGNTRECAKGIQMRNGVSRGRSHVVPENYALRSPHDMMNGGKWDNLPGELLLDIIQRVECGDISWLSRRDMVACAAVCRSWRDTVKQIVKSPEQCGLITFTMSLKQPGPRNTPIQCFIRRDRAASTFRLYLGLSPVIALAGDASKLLMVAKKVRKATRTEFLISLTADGFSRAINTCVGKLSCLYIATSNNFVQTMNNSNFLGTKFSVYDTQRSYDPVMKPTPKFSLKKVSPVVPLVVKSKVAIISYELNVLRTKGPRRMHCTMNSIPASLVQEGGSTLTQPTFPDQTTQTLPPESSALDKTEPLILRNKAPRWHEQLQCWCLNFKGRVTVASVKNFQLAVNSSQNGEAAEQDDVILQFGKIGKDIFTMDYQYPLSAFQAFAICLSSFDTKPACE